MNMHNLKLCFYLRMVGTKNLMVTSNSENISLIIEHMSRSINFLSLPDENVAIDFCIQTVLKDTRDRIQVIYFYRQSICYYFIYI